MAGRSNGAAARPKQLRVELPGYLVNEVTRAAKVRSRIERDRVTPAQLVERALRDYLWLDVDEMIAGEICQPGATVVAVPEVAAPGRVATFGQLLRQARQAKRCPVSQLAHALHMTAHQIYEIERGRRTPLIEARILDAARLLEVDPAPLLAAARQ